LKKFKIIYKGWVAVVEIDGKKPTLNMMRSQVLYRPNGERLINRAGDNIEMAYLKILTEEIISKVIDEDIGDVINHFDELEGFVPIDGSFGIKLVSIDSWNLPGMHIRDIFIEEVE